MKQFLKGQFHYSKICFSHNDWRIFVYCPWLPRSLYQLVYLAYRWIVCLYFLAWLGYAGYQSNINHGYKWPIFITAWTFVLLNVYLLLTAVICTFKYIYEIQLGITKVSMLQIRDLKDSPFLQCCLCCEKCSVDYENDEEDVDDLSAQQSLAIPWYIKIQWMLYILVSQTSILVVLFYWGNGLPISNWQVTLHEHLFILVPVFIDLFFTGYPLRFYHFIYSSLFGAVYITFSIIYYAAGGTNSNGDPYIYSPLDYGNSPITAIFMIIIICIIAPLLFNTFYWLLYLLRTYLIYKRISAVSLSHSGPSNTALYAKRSDSSIGMIETTKSYTDDDDGNVVSSVTVTIDASTPT